MGRLVRFIHNRDLATENIARAYVRQLLLLSCPARELAGLHQAVRDGTITLEKTSLLQPQEAHLASKTGTPGEYTVRVHRSTRLDEAVPKPSSEMTCAIRDMMQRFDLGEPKLEETVRLGSAVYINGRPYHTGDVFEYARHIERRAAARDLSQVTSTSNKLGRVAAVYLVPCSREPDEGGEVFFAFVDVPVTQTFYGCRRMHRPPEVPPAAPDAVLQYMHVDSVLFKVKVVPDVDNDQDYIGIRVWEAR